KSIHSATGTSASATSEVLISNLLPVLARSQVRPTTRTRTTMTATAVSVMRILLAGLQGRVMAAISLPPKRKSMLPACFGQSGRGMESKAVGAMENGRQGRPFLIQPVLRSDPFSSRSCRQGCGLELRPGQEQDDQGAE